MVALSNAKDVQRKMESFTLSYPLNHSKALNTFHKLSGTNSSQRNTKRL
jgi:hypothetical protein